MILQVTFNTAIYIKINFNWIKEKKEFITWFLKLFVKKVNSIIEKK